ncbi:MAG: hypothetical protein MZV70_45725 [Desulfobacterales bacterium]|nr:hypothetical protein [Desulfobacterales bacterium]
MRYEPGYGLVITIEIVEGDQYFVNKVNIDRGPHRDSAEELLKIVGHGEG